VGGARQDNGAAVRIAASEVSLDTCSIFFRTLRISGCLKNDAATLAQVTVLASGDIAQTFQVGLPHISGAEAGFAVDVFLKEEQYPMGAFIVFSFSDMTQEMIALYDLVYERLAATPAFAMYHRFLEAVAQPGFRRLLDVGGRDRSSIDRSKTFPKNDVTVLDILPGSNVQVVCDAHMMTNRLAPGSFDAIHSTSVFEHLLMPWKVVLEMNSLLRVGGLVYIHTHQSIGMHDEPTDFWRFSSHSWPGLFNAQTGFEVVEATMGHQSYLLPYFWRPDKDKAETARGFETSAMMARKVSESRLTWNVLPGDISSGTYPLR
jgi:Methyltransferase domain